MTEMNTLKAIESLTRTGFSEEQARAVVGVVSGAVENEAVTRQDFGELRREFGVLGQDFGVLKNDFGDLRHDFGALKSDFGDLRQEFGALKNDFGGLRQDFGDLRKDFGALETRVDARLDARFAQLETSIANAKVQMMLYTGAIVAGIAAVTRVFG